jgi:outer membrane protein assembly factor BamB
MKHFAWCLASLLALCAPLANALDWPQWQGPDRNGISRETGLLKEWPKGGPPLAWEIKGLGGGYSAPSVAAGKLYGMSSRGDYEVVWALNEADGKELWAARLGPAYRQGMKQGVEGPGCTPTVDGERLYVVGLAGDIACVATKDGSIVWQHSFTKDYGGRMPTWRYNESPLVDGEKVICTPGAPDAIMVALDKLTGNTIWKCAMPAGAENTGGGNRGGRGGGQGSGAAYSSAIAIDFDGQRQYVQMTSKALIGVSADGKFLWRYDRPANRAGINITTPLYHDGMIFASSAYNTGGGLIKLTRDANGRIKPEEVYFTPNLQNHHGGVILLDGTLYGANGGNEGGYLVCLDFATGKVLWDEKDAGKHRAAKGSITLADGRLYYRTEQGPMLLIEPSPKEYIERGRFDQPDRSPQPAWPHPVIANGKLYLRDQDVLLCYDIKAK